MKDINLEIEEYKEAEACMLDNIIFGLNVYITDIPVVKFFKEMLPKFKINELSNEDLDVEMCFDNIKTISNTLDHWVNHIKVEDDEISQQFTVRENNSVSMISDRSKKLAENMRRIAKAGLDCATIVVNAYEVLNIEQADEFLAAIGKINKKIDAGFKAFSAEMANMGTKDAREYCEKLHNSIIECIEFMPQVAKQQPVEVASDGVQKVTTVAKERERLEYIAKINATESRFIRLNNDLLRDIEQQHSASSKDLYVALTKKIKDFREELQLPISQYTKIGEAKNTYAKINRFFEKLNLDVQELIAASYVSY